MDEIFDPFRNKVVKLQEGNHQAGMHLEGNKNLSHHFNFPWYREDLNNRHSGDPNTKSKYDQILAQICSLLTYAYFYVCKSWDSHANLQFFFVCTIICLRN